MTDSDCTLSSPLSTLDDAASSLLALTIVWHPDRARIGAQFVSCGAGPALALNRYAPQFGHVGGTSLALGHGGISRQPLHFIRDGDDMVMLTLPNSPMVVEVNGVQVQESVQFDAAQIAHGQILTLGRAVVLCLHWVNRLPRDNPVPGLIGVGSAAVALRAQILLAAATDLTVLLLGETGTGKEIAARAIHVLGQRANRALVTVNMAALNEALAAADLFGAVKGAFTGAVAQRDGLFAQADGASLFLDEIGNAPASVQPMLLRVLEEGDYRPVGATRDRHATARLIAATDQNLDGAGFNQALLRRLEAYVIHMPPLRARREDIGVLLVHLLGAAGAALELPVALVTALAAYDWPGNVRQLAHAAKRAVLLLQHGRAPSFGDLVRVGQAPPNARPPQLGPAQASGARLRRPPGALSGEEILDAMVRHAWTIQTAALSLGISRPSLYKLLDAHPEIRRADAIPPDELGRAMRASEGDLARCAALLKTPAEALRRRWRQLGPT